MTSRETQFALTQETGMPHSSSDTEETVEPLPLGKPSIRLIGPLASRVWLAPQMLWYGLVRTRRFGRFERAQAAAWNRMVTLQKGGVC